MFHVAVLKVMRRVGTREKGSIASGRTGHAPSRVRPRSPSDVVSGCTTSAARAHASSSWMRVSAKSSNGSVRGVSRSRRATSVADQRLRRPPTEPPLLDGRSLSICVIATSEPASFIWKKWWRPLDSSSQLKATHAGFATTLRGIPGSRKFHTTRCSRASKFGLAARPLRVAASSSSLFMSSYACFRSDASRCSSSRRRCISAPVAMRSSITCAGVSVRAPARSCRTVGRSAATTIGRGSVRSAPPPDDDDDGAPRGSPSSSATCWTKP